VAATYDDWRERARAHLAAGNALDALSCFRHAARLRPDARGPRAGIAESLWRLGRPLDAIGVWREALQHHPDHLPMWQALADAAAFVGDPALASEAAARVLAADPQHRRARVIEACVRLADPATRDAAADDLWQALAAAPHLARQPHLARMLANALGALPGGACADLRRALATLVTADRSAPQWPLATIAAAAASLPTALLSDAVLRDVPAAETDDLRLLACALVIADDGRDDAVRATLAQRAAQRYGALCVERYGAGTPLLWPRRGAGAAARILVLVDAAFAGADDALWERLVAMLRRAGAGAHWSFAVFGDAARIVERLREALPAAVQATQLPPAPDVESARALAPLDADVLLDLVGLARPVGPLLAARPARRLVSLAGVPQSQAPLVDATVAESADWADALQEAIDTALRVPAAPSPPATLQARLAGAIAAHQRRDLAAARDAYDALLAEQPGHAPTLHLRGALRRDAGDIDGAREDFAAAVGAAPGDARSRAALAQLALDSGDFAQARRVAREGLDADAQQAPLVRVLGHAALGMRDPAAALEAFARAITLDPLDAQTHFNHGAALQTLGRLDAAARAYRRALDLAPDMLDADFNLAVVFGDLGQAEAAIAALEHVIARAPARAQAHRTLLNILARDGGGERWMRAFERFERDCPNALGIVGNALEFHQYRGDFAKVQQYVDRLAGGDFEPADELDLVDSLEELLYLMLFFDMRPATQASLYATYDAAARHVYGEPIERPPSRRAGRLRVGYLSADLRDHVMGRMMLEALAAHDRERFEVYFYSTTAAEDHLTEAYRAAGHAFVQLHQLDDASAVARIAEDDLDLLVDLSTHTRGARPAIMARKPARVAITHVASAGALGLSAVDFKLTDRFADLADSDQHHLETLLPMEGCVYPLRRIALAPDHPFQRAALGIAADAIVIGAFVTPLKLSRRTMALWREILERLPGARLAFSPNAPWLRDTYPAILDAAGIDRARAIMLPQGRSEGENLGRYAIVDLVLDPMPFGNVNGTLEPLNMGVPVVTLAGRTHGERTGYSILANLGETRTVATTGKEYVEIAVRLGSDAAFMRDVRLSLRERFAATVLADPADYARRLEAAYTSALAARGQLPDDGVAR
jgi:protein O-GlcNAc transferase